MNQKKYEKSAWLVIENGTRHTRLSQRLRPNANDDNILKIQTEKNPYAALIMIYTQRE